MKHLDSFPVNARKAGERVQQLNCDAPVAAIMRARLFFWIAMRMASAALTGRGQSQ
jgi:hypothetical protein